MRTPDEIKKGLRCCLKEDANHDCPTCPYLGDRKNYNCSDLLIADMFAYIQQLERERDAAMEDLEGERACQTCEYYDLQGYDCMRCSNSVSHPHWKWRGVEVE